MHPYWHLLADIDLREMVLSRPKQRAYLARYGRQQMGESLTLPELESRVRNVARIVADENSLGTLGEEGN